MARVYFRFKKQRQAEVRELRAASRKGDKKAREKLRRMETNEHGSWWVDYTNTAGERVQERTPARTRGEAEGYLHESRDDVYRQKKGWKQAAPAPVTFSAACARYRESVKHLSSYAGIDGQLRNYLEPALGKKLLTEITGEDLDRMIGRLRSTLEPGTLTNLLVRVGAVYTWARRKARIYTGESPTRDATRIIVPHRFPRVLTPAQLEGLLRAAGPWKLLFAFAALTGCRKGELCGAMWSDIDWDRAVITFRRSYDSPSTKAKKERVVPLHPTLLAALRVEREQSSSTYLFPRPNGGMRTEGGFDSVRLFRRVLAKAGVVKGYRLRCISRGGRKSCGYEVERAEKAEEPCPQCGAWLWNTPIHVDFHFKDLRSTFATRIGNLKMAQELLGHSSPTITAKHYHAAEMDRMREAVSALPTAWDESGTRPPMSKHQLLPRRTESPVQMPAYAIASMPQQTEVGNRC